MSRSRSRRLRLKFGSARLDRSYDLAPQAPRQGLDPRGIVDLDSVNVEHVTSLVEILLGQAHELVVIPGLDDQLVLRPESLVALDWTVGGVGILDRHSLADERVVEITLAALVLGEMLHLDRPVGLDDCRLQRSELRLQRGALVSREALVKFAHGQGAVGGRVEGALGEELKGEIDFLAGDPTRDFAPGLD